MERLSRGPLIDDNTSVSRILRALARPSLAVAALHSHSPPSPRQATPSPRTAPTCRRWYPQISRSRIPAVRSSCASPPASSTSATGRWSYARGTVRGRGSRSRRQRLYTHDAAGAWAPHSESTVGHFLFHPEHNHWHFYDFATYELRNVASGGAIGNNVLATSGKVTFCMVDSALVNSSLPHSAPAAYGQCTQTNPQGISVGWTDLYPAALPGQSLDVTNLPIGQYWLVVTADPSNRLLETNDTNNTAALKISIRGNRVTLAP